MPIQFPNQKIAITVVYFESDWLNDVNIFIASGEHAGWGPSPGLQDDEFSPSRGVRCQYSSHDEETEKNSP